MRKLLLTAFSLCMLLVLTGCQQTTSNQSKETMTLTTLNGNKEEVKVEFPAHPQRIAVLDYSALDILDALQLEKNIIGVAKGSTQIDYLKSYMQNDKLMNLGTITKVDMEALVEAAPDMIIIGGRLGASYDELSKIAPVYMISTDTSIGVVESTKNNAKKLASLFSLEDKVEELMDGYQQRIEALNTKANKQTAIVGIVTAGNFSVLGKDGRCSLISNEIGFDNIGIEDENSTSTHGNEASFEYILQKNPQYIFALDRDKAIGTQGAALAQDVLNNELINKTTAAKNNHVIVLDHSQIWYTAEGGITALDFMLQDIEKYISA